MVRKEQGERGARTKLPGGRRLRAVLFTSVAGGALAYCLSAAQAETLREAMILAYQHNPTLQAQRASVRATDEGVPQALSGWRPFVEILGDGGLLTESGDGIDGTDTGPTYGGSLRVTQNLYAGGGTVADVQRAENTVRAERARLASIEQTVLLNAVQAYMNVFRDEAVLRLNINNERVLGRQLEATRDRFNVGEVTRTDVSQAEAAVSGATADRIQAEGNVQISRGIYEQIVGKLPESLEKPEAIVDLPDSRRETVQTAQENNPDVLAALYDERAAISNVKVQSSELLPRVDVVGQGGRTGNEVGSSSTRDSGSIIAQLTVPLYQRGFATSRVREAKQVVGRNRMRLIEARRAATEDANNAWETLVTARARIQSIRAAVRANRIALEGVRQEALVGSRTVLDVLDAEQELLDSQVNLVLAERDETVAQYQLMSAIGRLTAPSLNLETEYYDPSRHYEKVRDKLWGLGGGDLDTPGAQPVRTK